MIRTPVEYARIENWTLFLLKGFMSVMYQQLYTDCRNDPRALPHTRIAAMLVECGNIITEIKNNQQFRKQQRKQRRGNNK